MIPGRGIAESVLRTDFVRGSPRPAGRGRGHQEWFHFSIVTPEITLLVNLSVSDDLRTGAERGAERGRQVVLVHAAGAWEGDADEIDAPRIRAEAGRIAMTLADTNLDFRDGVFRLEGALQRRPVRFVLELRPETFPWIATNVQLGERSDPIHWALVPRLVARGWVSVDGQRHTLDGALAYHDHNWGFFRHGGFSWQWGHACPNDASNPLTFVMSRLLDRDRSSSLRDTLLLWRGARQYRILSNDDIEFETTGYLRERAFTVPRRARVLVSADAADVPSTLKFVARADGDLLRGAFEAETMARIVVPHDDDLGTTSIHEVVGRFALEGRIRDEEINFEGRGVFEFLGRAG